MTLKRLRRFYFLLNLLLTAAALSAPVSAAEADPFGQSTQIIVVTTADWNAVQGRLQRYERGAPHEAWRAIGEPVAIVVGIHGMGWGLGVVATDDAKVRRPSDPVKKEGDGKSPAGVFALGTAFGDASQPLPGLKLPYLALTPSIECVDDVRSKFYNRLVDRSTVHADWNSSEHMRDVGEAYRWGVVVDHNAGAVPGGGSCVFLHIWGGPTHGTAGCTAMTQGELQVLLTWLDPARKPLLVQLPAPEYGRLIHVWGLPALP
jgi:D-alanyl-D-alanine dipeptidase